MLLTLAFDILHVYGLFIASKHPFHIKSGNLPAGDIYTKDLLSARVTTCWILFPRTLNSSAQFCVALPLRARITICTASTPHYFSPKLNAYERSTCHCQDPVTASTAKDPGNCPLTDTTIRTQTFIRTICQWSTIWLSGYGKVTQKYRIITRIIVSCISQWFNMIKLHHDKETYTDRIASTVSTYIFSAYVEYSI